MTEAPPLAPFATRRSTRGMVCSVDHLASGAGVTVLRHGGSAADAAIAANAVLAVTSQHMCGLGGDLFALVHAGTGPPVALNASGRAGSGADAERLRDEGHTAMPPSGDIRSVPVPGCVDGWLALHARFGRLPLAEVLEPARSYAAEGFPASPGLVAAAARVAHLPAGRELAVATAPGALVRRPGVVRLLSAIATGGREGFYGGELGAELLELGRSEYGSEYTGEHGGEYGGEYTESDLAAPLAGWVEPLATDAWGHRLWTIPPNSQGYLTLAGAWIADALDLPEDPADSGWAHLLIESARQAAFDRLDVLHEHADGPALLDPARLGPRRDAIDPSRAAVLGVPTAPGGTTALCAADGDGMGVSLIQSNAAGFGSMLATPQTRVFLQNRGVGFSLSPGHPAEYGPGRRPPHTLSPVLVTRNDGSLALLAGTEGGDTQPQVLLQLLARRLRARQSPAAALAAGRWSLRPRVGGAFDTWSAAGDLIVALEGHVPEAWAGDLTQRGHAVRTEASWSGFGLSHLLATDRGVLFGASDPRSSESQAAGY